MNKKPIAILLVILMFVLSACGALKDATVSTIYVDKNGKVSSVTIASLPAEQYDEKELKKSIDDAIDDYNGSQEKVELDSFKVKKEQAHLLLTYATTKDYESFNGRVLFAGTMAEARSAGYNFEGEFIDSKKVTTTGSAILKEAIDELVIITNEPVQIKTSKDILYVSANATIIDKRVAQVEAEAGATDNGITFGNAENAYIIYGEPKK